MLSSSFSVSLRSPSDSFGMAEPIFMKLGAYIMAHKPISTTYFVNISQQSLSLCVSHCR
jgi:hypothetical protein